MPPKGSPAPTQNSRAAAVSVLRTLLAAPANLPHVTLRRLNRFEYENTIRDLTGVEYHASDEFPSDDVGYGFDNIGDVLSISPLLMEKYLRAAQQIATKAIVAPEDRVSLYEGKRLPLPVAGGNHVEDGVMLFTNATVAVNHPFTPGRYRLKVTVTPMQAGPERVKIAVGFRGNRIAVTEVDGSVPISFEYPIECSEAGVFKVDVSFVNDYYKADAPPKERDRNVIVNAVEIDGPFGGGAISPWQAKYVPANSSSASLRSILKTLATRAYRRPLTAPELDRLAALSQRALDGGMSVERAAQLGLTAILTSPNFLFKVEPSDAAKPLDAYQVATRLSYFLWSSMPDEELTRLAAGASLLKPEVLKQQVARMVSDPRCAAMADSFAAQWLELRKLHAMTLDKGTFPAFSEDLRDDLIAQSKAFFLDVVRNDRSVVEFLDSNFTYANDRLAKAYGLGSVSGPEMRRVPVPPGQAGGLLSQGSFLMVTSNPTRTSPVKRGKWVLDNLLGAPMPPPPPGVGNLGDNAQILDAKTLRARMEAHRAKPECAVCHNKLDPIGFSLENYDAMGRWRDQDAGAKIDSEGVMPDGTKFAGVAGLRSLLLKRKDEFVQCLAEKLLTYALGRGLTSADEPLLKQAVQNARANGYRFSSLIETIVLSSTFTQHRMEGR